MESIVERLQQLHATIDVSPHHAISEALSIVFNCSLEQSDRFNIAMMLASILVDGGAITEDKYSIEEGLSQLQHLCAEFDHPQLRYNLANAYRAKSKIKSKNIDWLGHQENARYDRNEARKIYWGIATNPDVDVDLRTQAWTNLGNLFSNSFRLWEAHDSWDFALQLDSKNGVAAACAAQNLFWLCEHSIGSDFARVEAEILASIARQNAERIEEYAGSGAARNILEYTRNFEQAEVPRSQQDPFRFWIEKERLSLAPVSGRIDPVAEHLDWLQLRGVYEHKKGSEGRMPSIFPMFNTLKADYMLARDLLWRSQDEGVWLRTSDFDDTLDYALYGPDTSALVLAYRCSLDLLDKVAAAANQFFNFGWVAKDIKFSFWRDGDRKLKPEVQQAIRSGAHALYGLVELAGDYAAKNGIYEKQQITRNTATHRFVILHDGGHPKDWRVAPEIEHHRLEDFRHDALVALRVARSAIQMLTLAIQQHTESHSALDDLPVSIYQAPSHDRIRGRKD